MGRFFVSLAFHLAVASAAGYRMLCTGGKNGCSKGSSTAHSSFCFCGVDLQTGCILHACMCVEGFERIIEKKPFTALDIPVAIFK